MSYLPDWHENWTAEQAEAELVHFKFKGPGIYRAGGDTILVLPLNRDVDNVFDAAFEPDEMFQFLVWNASDPGPLFNKLPHAPIR